MQPSPLQLEAYFLKELTFTITDQLETPPKRSAKADNLGIKVQADAGPRDDDPFKWRCELTVESVEEAEIIPPYRFRITFVGFFHVAKGYPAERVELMARTNAPALLFSAAREALVPITSRGPYPAIVLPSVTFLEAPPATKLEGSNGPAASTTKGATEDRANKRAARNGGTKK